MRRKLRCIEYAEEKLRDNGCTLDNSGLYRLLEAVYKAGYKARERVSLVPDDDQPRLPYLD